MDTSYYYNFFNKFVLSLAALVITASALADDECRAILEQGVRNTYSFTRSGDLKSNLKNSFCNEKSVQAKDQSGGGISLAFPYAGNLVSLGGNYNQSNGKALHEQSCADANSSMSNENYEQLLQYIADPRIVQAWSECIHNKGGPLLNGEIDDEETVSISLKFRNIGGVSETILTKDTKITGARCEDMDWEKGKIINGSEQFLTCERIGKRPVSVTVNSAFNGVRLYIPSPPALVPVSPSTVRPEPPVARDVRVCFIPSNPPRPGCPAENQQANEGDPCHCGSPPMAVPFDGFVRLVSPDPNVIPARDQGSSQVIPAKHQ